jgi:hypothetical protein
MNRKYYLFFLLLLFASCKTTPVNPVTGTGTMMLQYTVAKRAYVKLTIENSYGTTVETLVDKQQDAGSYAVGFSRTRFPEGLYYYVLSLDGNQITRRMIILAST